MTALQYDLFISYSSQDGDWVRSWLLHRLEEADLRVCIDYRDFAIGQPALVNMERAVKQSRRTLLVFSPNWVRSEWTTFEALLVQTRDPAGIHGRMMPVMLENCDLPDRLSMLTWADFRERSNWETELERIVGQLEISNEVEPAKPAPYRVLVLGTSKDMGEALEDTVTYLREILGMDAASGSEDAAPDPSGFDLVVLVQAWWWAGGMLAEFWSGVPESQRILFLVDEESNWPPRRYMERNADDAITAFRESHGNTARVFTDPDELPNLIGKLAEERRRAEQPDETDAGLSELERAYLALRLPTWKAGRTGAGKGFTGPDDIYEERFYVSLGGVSHRWQWDEEQAALVEAELERGEPMRMERAGRQAARQPLAWWASRAELPWLALSGSPGAGKTVFLTRFAAALAERLLGGVAELERHLDLESIRARGKIPIPLTLEATRLAERTEQGLDVLTGAILDELGCAGALDLPEPRDVGERLCAGRYLILIDALDEVPGMAGRKRLLALLKGLRQRLGKTRLLLTTRSARYTGELGFGPELEVLDLTDLSETQVDAFCERFRVVKGEPPAFLERLRAALRGVAERAGSDETNLIANPLLLTSACSVFHKLGHLPNDRAALCYQIVEHLCQSKVSRHTDREDWALFPVQKRDLLERIALAMQQEKAQEWPMGRVADVVAVGLPEDERRERDRIEQYLKWLVEHTGLLYLQAGKQGETVRFHHRLFREYLAACRLTKGNALIEEVLAALWREEKLTDPAWLDVVRLMPGAMNNVDKATVFAGHLRDLAARQTRQRGPLLALLAAALLESKNLFGLFDIVGWIEEAVKTYEYEGKGWPTATRLLFLESIGWLGDPRPDPWAGENWIHIEPGRFTMGSEGVWAAPERSREIVTEFWLARYPVTNAEYRGFVDDGGYRRRELWSNEGWEWLQLEGETFDQWFEKLREKYGSHRRPEWYRPGTEPLYWNDHRFANPNQPVVGINWFEANAYCAWLTAELAARRPEWWTADESPRVVLPAEVEWDAAARGGEVRPYPWGDEEEKADRANYHQTGLEKTSPVGAFPVGATPEGIQDMAGNVWEWCRDVWSWDAHETRKKVEGNPENTNGDSAVRVLRGGAWDDGAGRLRASIRIRFHVWYRDRDVGFRCCLCRLVFTSVKQSGRWT